MITVAPNATFVAFITNAPAGVHWWTRVTTPAGAEVVARHDTGVTETAPGTYTSVMTAPALPGSYVVTWDDGTDFLSEAMAVTNAPVLSADYRPDVSDVAVLMRARTRDRVGNEGTFTADTRPTAAEVDHLVTLVTGAVRSQIGGPDIPPVLADEARMVIAYGVAQLVEQSYFPEQNDGEGPAARFGRLYDTALASLAKNQASYSSAARAGGGMSIGSMRVGTATSQMADQWL